MPKLKSKRGFRYVRELGGAIRRATVSFGADWLIQNDLVQGRVLDYGCGYGLDADRFGWNAFDPYYRQQEPTGKFDTIICNHVLNMLTRDSRHRATKRIQGLLTEVGVAWLIVPRNIPHTGKVAMRKRIQNYVRLELPSVYSDGKREIYRMDRVARLVDVTEEIENRLAVL